MILGQHCTWDVYNCEREKLAYVPFIQDVLNKIVDELGLSKIDMAFKQFEPVGVTGFILLEESHISIHTWPEHNFAAIDVFSCHAFDIHKVSQLLERLLMSDKIICQHWERGQLPVRDMFFSG